MNPQPPAPTCVRHPNRPTGLACTRCGRPSCPECLRAAAVGQHCVDCLREGQRDTPPIRNAAGAVARSLTPYVTYVLIAINVAIFAVTAAQAGSLTDNYYGSPLFARWMLVPGLVADGEWVRVLGSGFLHRGPLDLALTMFTLWIVGRSVEAGLGRERYLAVYLVALLGGAAAGMLFQDPGTASAGAFGAVYGLAGAMTVIVIRLRQSPVGMLVVIAISIALGLGQPGAWLFTYLGGLLAGGLATLGVLFLPEWLRARDQRAARGIGWASIASVAVVDLVVIAAAASALA